jgi:hypothetical protein
MSPARGLATNVRKEVAVAGLSPLMAALRRPSATQTLTSRVVWCPVVARIVPWLVLIGRDGQLIQPRIPVGACGVPVAPVLASLNSLHWINLPAPIATKLPAAVDPPPVNY